MFLYKRCEYYDIFHCSPRNSTRNECMKDMLNMLIDHAYDIPHIIREELDVFNTIHDDYVNFLNNEYKPLTNERKHHLEGYNVYIHHYRITGEPMMLHHMDIELYDTVWSVLHANQCC